MFWFGFWVFGGGGVVGLVWFGFCFFVSPNPFGLSTEVPQRIYSFLLASPSGFIPCLRLLQVFLHSSSYLELIPSPTAAHHCSQMQQPSWYHSSSVLSILKAFFFFPKQLLLTWPEQHLIPLPRISAAKWVPGWLWQSSNSLCFTAELFLLQQPAFPSVFVL